MVVSDIVASLRKRIQDIEGRDIRLDVPEDLSRSLESKAVTQNSEESALPLWRLGLPEVDDALPGGALVIGGLHEVIADYAHMPAASGFCVALLVRLLTGLRMSDRRMVLWCTRGQESRAFGLPYGPGLLDLGISPDRLLFVRAEKPADLAWAMEEGVRTPALAGVFGELGPASLTVTRRLLLAARDSGVAGLILRDSADHRPSAALTTWHIEAVCSGLQTHTQGQGRWRVTLEHCRGGGAGGGKWPQSWDLEWNSETHHFHMAASLVNRPSAASRPFAVDRPVGSAERQTAGIKKAG